MVGMLLQKFRSSCPEVFYKKGVLKKRPATLFKEVLYKKKLVDETSLNFPELFIIGKYVKIRFKNRGSPCYFLSSRGQKIKNITKIEHARDCFCLHSWFHSLHYRAKTDLYNKYMISLCVWLIF